MSKNKQYPIKAITIGIIIIAVGYSIFASYDPDNEDIEISPMLTVNVIEAKKQTTHERKRSFLGKVEARRSTNLSFEIAGAVQEILVKEGETVVSGQPVAILDVDHLLAKHQEVEAEIERANAMYELTRLTKNRTAEASQYRAVSEIDRDQADQNFSAQEAALAGVRARLFQIEIEIEKGILAAPYSGVISRRYVDEGTVVEEGSQVLQLVETDHLEARIGVKNPQFLQVGQVMQLITSRGPVEGVLSSVLPVRDSATRNIEVIFSITNHDVPLRPGDAVTLVVDEIIDGEGIWLPTSALTESNRGLWAVYIAVPEEEQGTYKLVLQELEIIDQTTESVFVRSPIQDGSLIVRDGMNRVVPGLIVHIKKSE